jgi:hypothetical protein
MYSYHIFYFPFKWENPEMKEKSFSEQTCLEELKFNTFSNWLHATQTFDPKEVDELYNEKNYYYQFVHPVLYDTGEKDSILKHFERKEPNQRNVIYKIAKKGGKIYSLKVDAINLNLYTTGVGILTFYLANDREDQKEPDDILAINQYGRRVFPPFMGDIETRNMIAEYISIEGLYGEASSYYEDFKSYTNEKYWEPSCIIKNLIQDLIADIKVVPVIDDRMFVNCWYKNDYLSNKIKDDTQFCSFQTESDDHFWYQFLFVDSGGATCQNKKLMENLLEKHTYNRWQKYGSLYGVSRYSFVVLTDDGWFANDILLPHIRTIYSRMIELVLIQRASILKFSGEVTRVSKLSENKKGYEPLITQISSLYRNYIRFVNQIYFREALAQEQGIELYQLTSTIFETKDQIKDLDNEIEELHQYISLEEDKERNRKSSLLNIIAAIFLPATLIAGLFGMNKGGDLADSFWWQSIIVFISTGLMFGLLQLINHKNK